MRLAGGIPDLGFHRSPANGTFPGGYEGTQNTEISIALTENERQKQDALIHFLVAGASIKGILATACCWYSVFLQSKFKLHWHILAMSLDGLDDNSTAPSRGDLSVVYTFVHEIAKMLKSTANLALVTIVDELDNANLLKPQLDEERAIPNQAVWAAIGWITMLYEAIPDPKPDKLEVTRTSTSLSGYRNQLFSRKYFTFKQGFDHTDMPLYRMISKFGDLIPEIPTPLPYHRASETIKVPSVCFITLQNLADLKIEWVTSLSLHLELDSSRKTLKLFQFPSFCRMMITGEGDSALSRLLNNNAARSSENVTEPEVPSQDFFREILLSYRVIFGQDERSWKAFSRIIPAWEDRVDLSSNPSWESSWDCDPLLHVLCGRSVETPEARQVYEEVDANEPTSNYIPHADFKFFGKRLLDLQDFIDQHQPRNVRGLLNDRRDVAAWYTLWNNQLLIIFATVTIFFMVLSFVFQVWQVWLAKEQLKQGVTQ